MECPKCGKPPKYVYTRATVTNRYRVYVSGIFEEKVTRSEESGRQFYAECTSCKHTWDLPEVQSLDDIEGFKPLSVEDRRRGFHSEIGYRDILAELHYWKHDRDFWRRQHAQNDRAAVSLGLLRYDHKQQQTVLTGKGERFLKNRGKKNAT